MKSAEDTIAGFVRLLEEEKMDQLTVFMYIVMEATRHPASEVWAAIPARLTHDFRKWLKDMTHLEKVEFVFGGTHQINDVTRQVADLLALSERT